MPSALSVSRAYSISLRLPATSGGAITANSPKRPGCSLAILVAYSWSPRARLRDCSTLLSYQTPGWTTDRTAVAIPLLSMSSIDMAGDHFGGAPVERRPDDDRASTWAWVM